jgi:hypothetical protein
VTVLEAQGSPLFNLGRYSESLNVNAAAVETLRHLRAATALSGDNLTRAILLQAQAYSFMADNYRALGMTESSILFLQAVSVDTPMSGNVHHLIDEATAMYECGDISSASQALLAAGRETIALQDRTAEARLTAKLGNFYRRVFALISWMPGQDKIRRSSDPRDFVDISGIGLGRGMKYGMIDESEDFATFLTAWLLGDHDRGNGTPMLPGGLTAETVKAETDMVGYVRAQMDECNFEPAAKYLYFRYLMFGCYGDHLGYSAPGPGDVTDGEVIARMRGVPSQLIDGTTRLCIDVLADGYELLRAFEVARRVGESGTQLRQVGNVQQR